MPVPKQKRTTSTPDPVPVRPIVPRITRPARLPSVLAYAGSERCADRARNGDA